MDIRSTNPENLDRLLKTVGSKLNMPPERLKRELMQGKFDSAIKNMKPDEAHQSRKAPEIKAALAALTVLTALPAFAVGGHFRFEHIRQLFYLLHTFGVT